MRRAGRGPRLKGDRAERKVVETLRSLGLAARRIPQSGSARDFKGDVEVQIGLGLPKVLEVKARGQFKQLLQWLGDNFCLVLVPDRSAPLFVLPLSSVKELVEDVKILLDDIRHLQEGDVELVSGRFNPPF